MGNMNKTTCRILTATVALVLLIAVLPAPAFAASEQDEAAAELVNLGILKGDENGNLNLGKGLTRAELAVLMSRLDGLDGKWENSSYAATLLQYNSTHVKFTDVPAWAMVQVAYCHREGLLKGYSDVKFGSNDPVNPKAICTLMLRWLGQTEGNGWTYDTSVEKAAALGLLPSGGLDAKAAMTVRGDVSVVINKAIKQKEETPANNTPITTLPGTPGSDTVSALPGTTGTSEWVGTESIKLQTINGYEFPVDAGGTIRFLQNREPTIDEAYALAEEVVRLVNIERAKEGLRELALMPEMMDVAKRKSQDMIDYNYYSHYPKEGPYSRLTGNTGFMLDEVPLPGFGGTREECIDGGAYTPETVVKRWMASSGHRAILLKAHVTHIGVGFASKMVGSGDGRWTLIVKEWTDVAVENDTRGLYPYVEATNPATGSTPLKTK
jgi:uncharacterized protein YkwD